MTDLNTLIPADSGWTLLAANAINDNGQAVGYYVDAQGVDHAFLYSGGNYYNLGVGTNGGQATGIDDNGDIVGSYTDSAGQHIATGLAEIGRDRVVHREPLRYLAVPKVVAAIRLLWLLADVLVWYKCNLLGTFRSQRGTWLDEKRGIVIGREREA